MTVGRSTRADVFKALGQPKQTERSASGEAWVYEAREPKQNLNRLAGGAAAGSAIAGAFIPYVGLLGSGLGLANAAAGPGAPPASTTLTVAFGETGLVRDCIVATTAPPTPQAAGQPPLDCTRPVTR